MKLKCKKHPKYKGIMHPKVNCKKCIEIFEYRQQLSLIELCRERKHEPGRNEKD